MVRGVWALWNEDAVSFGGTDLEGALVIHLGLGRQYETMGQDGVDRVEHILRYYIAPAVEQRLRL